MKKQKNTIRAILKQINTAALEYGVKDASLHVLESYKHILSGYSKTYDEVFGGRFESCTNNDIIFFGKIDFISTCAHHFIPLTGIIEVAYIPDGNIVGFGRIQNLVRCVTRRLQLQEKIASEIADTIANSELNPKGVFVRVEAQHSCVFANPSVTSPSSLQSIVTTGEFKFHENIYKLSLLKNR